MSWLLDHPPEFGLRAEHVSGAKTLPSIAITNSRCCSQNLSKVLEKGSKITLVLPWGSYEEIPPHIEKVITSVGSVHAEDKDFGFIFLRYLSFGLREGWFKAQPTKVVPGGLGGVQYALEELKAGRVNATKLVFEIKATEGLS
jgi:NADPH:quinone reductase